MSSTNRGAKRRERDAYPTPKWCTEALLDELVIPPNATVLEPCIGTGAIWDVLKTEFSEENMHWCEIEKGRDFFEIPIRGPADFIITNPPFSLAKEFIDRSLTLANCVVMLLPKSFFGSKGRKEWWQRNKPTAEFTLSQRPSFTGDGKTDSEVYSWVMWDYTGRQKKGWYWL